MLVFLRPCRAAGCKQTSGCRSDKSPQHDSSRAVLARRDMYKDPWPCKHGSGRIRSAAGAPTSHVEEEAWGRRCAGIRRAARSSRRPGDRSALATADPRCLARRARTARVRRQGRRGAAMFSGFRQFVMRGNVLDLAVAVVMGGAFGAVVTAMVKDLLTPLIAAIAGKPDFSAISLTINNSQLLIGAFINDVISFLLIAAALYFFVVAPVNALVARRQRGEAPPDPTTKKCPECLSEVPIAASRCAFCTSQL